MLDLELQIIHRGYDRKTCWVHPRPGMIPGDPPTVVVTMQKLRLTAQDVFYALNEVRSHDGGMTWTGPVEHAETLGRHKIEGGVEEGLSDFWPMWHDRTGVLLGTGHTIRYTDDELQNHPRPRGTGYSTYDPTSRTWSAWRKLELPEAPEFFSEGAGSTQRHDLPNGDILLPTYFALMETARGAFLSQDVATVMRCTFDGATLAYVEHGDEFTLTKGWGFSEPSLAFFQGHFYLTLRNDDHGYVTSGSTACTSSSREYGRSMMVQIWATTAPSNTG